MKIYVAGNFNNKLFIRSKMNELEKLGCTITHDWTNCKSNDFSVAATKDMNGVKECDILVVIMTDKKKTYRGTFTEIGCGLGANKTILLYNPHEYSFSMTNCFYFHPAIIHFKKWEDCVNYIIKELHRPEFKMEQNIT